jgi:hypothetical protein
MDMMKDALRKSDVDWKTAQLGRVVDFDGLLGFTGTASLVHVYDDGICVFERTHNKEHITLSSQTAYTLLNV